MKPKEFDDLVRNKFDQNDFAYNPQNWGKLAEKLDGTKKRSLIALWWIPLTGLAASLLMAMGVTSLIHHQSGLPSVNTGYTQSSSYLNNKATEADRAPLAAIQGQTTIPFTHRQPVNKKVSGNTYSHPVKDNTDKWFSIRLQNAIVLNAAPAPPKFRSLTGKDLPELKAKATASNEPHATFKPDAEIKKAPKLSVILSGGIDHGNQSSGYIVGATLRRMITDKVYIEGDLGFASSTNTQAADYTVETISHVASAPLAARASSARTTSAGSISGKVSSTESLGSTTQVTTYSTDQRNVSYNLDYAQITPSVGYKLLKRMSLGIGPDFQQMLVDNRPAPSPSDRANIQEAAMFDVGFIGKTEYVITKKLKAGVYYRKGINDLISTNDKYIDRDYLQFQLKWVILNK